MNRLAERRHGGVERFDYCFSDARQARVEDKGFLFEI